MNAEHDNNKQNLQHGNNYPTTPVVSPKAFHFVHPFTCLVVAPSGFGKSYWVKRLLAERNTLIQPPPERIVWCYKNWQALYSEIEELDSRIEFVRDLPLDLDSGFFSKSTKNLLIVDDMMELISKDQRLTSLFTRGSHHENLSVICLLQSMYYKNTQTMRRNSHYLILFDMPSDRTQVRTISYQMFPTAPHYLLENYNRAVAKPYGYLVVVSKPNIKQDERLKTDIFKDEKSTDHRKDDRKSTDHTKKPDSPIAVVSQEPDRPLTVVAQKPQMGGRPEVVEEVMTEPMEDKATGTEKARDLVKEVPGEREEVVTKEDKSTGMEEPIQIDVDKPVMIDGQLYRVEEAPSHGINGQLYRLEENENEADKDVINNESDVEFVQSLSLNESDNMHACQYCGALFEGRMHKNQHEKECAQMDFDEKEPFENEGYQQLRREAKEENHEAFEEKVEKYKDQGMSLTDAREKANDKMETQDRRSFHGLYTDQIKLQVQLDESSLHNSVITQVKEMVDYPDVSLDQAIKRVLSRHRKDIDTVMDTYLDETDQETEGEEMEDENDDNNDEDTNDNIDEDDDNEEME